MGWGGVWRRGAGEGGRVRGGGDSSEGGEVRGGGGAGEGGGELGASQAQEPGSLPVLGGRWFP